MIQKLVKLKRRLVITIMTNNITTPEFNNLAAGVFTARLAQVDSVTKTDLDSKLQDISKRITSNKTKHLLVENEMKKN